MEQLKYNQILYGEVLNLSVKLQGLELLISNFDPSCADLEHPQPFLGVGSMLKDVIRRLEHVCDAIEVDDLNLSEIVPLKRVVDTASETDFDDLLEWLNARKIASRVTSKAKTHG